MAKPDDTRIAHASANASSTSSNTSSASSTTSSSSTSSNNTSTLGSSTTLPGITRTRHTRPRNAELIALLEALIGKLVDEQSLPLPPKSARPPRIKPRRRVTVSACVGTASAATTPWLRLCGNWLVPAGFKLHTKAHVHVAKGFLLVIPEGES